LQVKWNLVDLPVDIPFSIVKHSALQLIDPIMVGRRQQIFLYFLIQNEVTNMKADEIEKQEFSRSGRGEQGSSVAQPCPVAIQAKEVLRSSEQTAKAMRLLRRTFMECEHCPEFGFCELREEFNRQVDIAIAELLEEWGW
jgi:hypothetical protein